MRSSKVVGKPLGQHGANIYHKEFHVTTDKVVKKYRLGEFYFVRKSLDSPVAVAEFQLIWRHIKSDDVSASVKLYVRPENSSSGRTEMHGKDEVLEITHQFAVRGIDFPAWECSSDCWYAGSGDFVYKDVAPDMIQRCLTACGNQNLDDEDLRHCHGGTSQCRTAKEFGTVNNDESSSLSFSDKDCKVSDARHMKIHVVDQSTTANGEVGIEQLSAEFSDVGKSELVCDAVASSVELKSEQNMFEDSASSVNSVQSHSCVTVVSFSKYCRYMACLKLLQMGVYMPRHVLLMRGGIDVMNPNTVVLFSRWQTLINEVDDFSLLSEVKVPVFSGRPRKRKLSCTYSPPTKKQFNHAVGTAQGAVGKPGFRRPWRRLQDLHKLNSEGDERRKDLYPQSQQAFVAELFHVMQELGRPIRRVPRIGAKKVDLFKLFTLIFAFGGYNRVSVYRQWRHVYRTLEFPVEMGGNGGYTLKKHYERLLYPYEKFVRDRSKAGVPKKIGRPAKEVAAVEPNAALPESPVARSNSLTGAADKISCADTKIIDRDVEDSIKALNFSDPAIRQLRRGREKPPPLNVDGDEIYKKRRGRPPNWLRRRLAIARDASLIAQLSASSGHSASRGQSLQQYPVEDTTYGSLRPEPCTAKFIVEKKRGRPTNELKQKLARARELYKTVEVQLPTTRDSRVPKWLRAFSEKSGCGGEIIVKKNRCRNQWKAIDEDMVGSNRAVSDTDEPPTMSRAARPIIDRVQSLAKGRDASDDEVPLSSFKSANTSSEKEASPSCAKSSANSVSSALHATCAGSTARKRIDDIGRSLLKRASNVTEPTPEKSVFSHDGETIRQASPVSPVTDRWSRGASRNSRSPSEHRAQFPVQLASHSRTHVRSFSHGPSSPQGLPHSNRVPRPGLDGGSHSLAYNKIYPERKFRAYKFVEHYPPGFPADGSSVGSRRSRKLHSAGDSGLIPVANGVTRSSLPLESMSGPVGVYYVPVAAARESHLGAYSHQAVERRRDVGYVFHTLSPPSGPFDDAYCSTAAGELPSRFASSSALSSMHSASERHTGSPPTCEGSSRTITLPPRRIGAATDEYVGGHPNAGSAYVTLFRGTESLRSPPYGGSKSRSSPVFDSRKAGGELCASRVTDGYYSRRPKSRSRSPLQNGCPTEAWVASHPGGTFQDNERNYVHIPRSEPPCSTPCKM